MRAILTWHSIEASGSPRSDAPEVFRQQVDWLRSGRVTIGAHTRTQPRLTSAGTDIMAELRGADDSLERELGTRPAGFAYPFGACDACVTSAVAQTYRWACTPEFRPLSGADDPHLRPRLDAWYFRDHRRLDAWGSARFRAWVWARNQGRAVRKALTAVSERA